MDIDTSQLSSRDAYGLLTSFVVPRPIAWITTMDGAGHVNLAPFSYFNAVCADPPLISVSITTKKGGVLKDTFRLIEQTGQFCVNLVEEPMVNAMNASSEELPPEVSEAEALGLATVPCASIAGVRLADCRGALECRLVDVHPYGRKVKVNLVIAEVVRAYIDDGIVIEGEARVDPHKIAPVGRLGGRWYARLGERFAAERPKVSSD